MLSASSKKWMVLIIVLKPSKQPKLNRMEWDWAELDPPKLNQKEWDWAEPSPASFTLSKGMLIPGYMLMIKIVYFVQIHLLED